MLRTMKTAPTFAPLIALALAAGILAAVGCSAPQGSAREMRGGSLWLIGDPSAPTAAPPEVVLIDRRGASITLGFDDATGEPFLLLMGRDGEPRRRFDLETGPRRAGTD